MVVSLKFEVLAIYILLIMKNFDNIGASAIVECCHKICHDVPISCFIYDFSHSVCLMMCECRVGEC